MDIPEFKNEQHFEREWVEIATAQGWATMHVKKASNRTPTSITGVEGTTGKGWPDRMIWHPEHRGIFVESKMDDGELSDEQSAVLRSLADAGFRTAIWRPKFWHSTILPVLIHGGPAW